MVPKIEPLGERLVVKPIEKEEVTKGGIVLPDTAKERPQEGEVIAVGPGRLSEDGKQCLCHLAGGDPEHKAGENHPVYVRRSSGIGPDNTHRAESSGSGDMEFDISEFGYQVAGERAISAICLA